VLDYNKMSRSDLGFNQNIIEYVVIQAGMGTCFLVVIWEWIRTLGWLAFRFSLILGHKCLMGGMSHKEVVVIRPGITQVI